MLRSAKLNGKMAHDASNHKPSALNGGSRAAQDQRHSWHKQRQIAMNQHPALRITDHDST